MPLAECHARLEAQDFGKVILVIDASGSAQGQQPAIAALAADMLSSLPAKVERALYFLGNPRPYPHANLAARSAQWFTDNRRRASILTPILETLPPDDKSTLVVIGAGGIYDLEDWVASPLLRRAVLANVGIELWHGEQPPTVEEIANPTAQELVQRVHDPVVGVAVSSPGFMPISWDNREYVLTIADDGRVSLVAGKTEEYSICMCFYTVDANGTEVTIRRSSGDQLTEPLRVEPAARMAPPITGQLSPEEVEIFRGAVAGKPFKCGRGGSEHEHAWDTLRCLEGKRIAGELIYPSLEACKASGFVILRPMGDTVEFQVRPCGVLRIGDGSVAMRDGQRAVVYRLDERAARWAATNEVLPPYHPVGEDGYAILL
jgi:hypothetical protein